MQKKLFLLLVFFNVINTSIWSNDNNLLIKRDKANNPIKQSQIPITSVVKADVLSAASFVLYSGAVALYTAVATGGTSVLPTVAAVAGRAAFGSAVRGIAYLF